MHVIRYGLRAEPISLSQLKRVVKTMKISRKLLLLNKVDPWRVFPIIYILYLHNARKNKKIFQNNLTSI